LLTVILAFVAGLYFPWWSIAVTSFVVALLIPLHPGKSFLTGFTGLFLLWGTMAFYIDMKNESLLSVKIASILPFGGSSVSIILVTALTGALVGGLSAITGAFLRRIFSFS
ncbi:MAG TPA: hypothetical protein VIK74_08615, partial [Parasegetibacter sp.]